MIVIDPPMLWKESLGPSCHLMSTLNGKEGTRELIEFAERIGLNARRIQKRGTRHEHFDVWGDKIARARAAGAKDVDRAGIVNVMREKKRFLSSQAKLPGMLEGDLVIFGGRGWRSRDVFWKEQHVQHGAIGDGSRDLGPRVQATIPPDAPFGLGGPVLAEHERGACPPPGKRSHRTRIGFGIAHGCFFVWFC